tara:strand:+ start:4272 stop:4712 length:441 start_codon:yes stop_codon:yes gene_type:complete
MVTFRNNNRRSSFRGSNNRRSSFRNNNEGSKFSHNDNFQRRSPGRNNHNAVKLIEKYNDLAREALASGDKILSESYFQHADHFTRIQKEQENARVARVNSASVTAVKSVEAKNEDHLIKETSLEQEDKKVTKTIDKKTEEKETAAS